VASQKQPRSGRREWSGGWGRDGRRDGDPRWRGLVATAGRPAGLGPGRSRGSAIASAAGGLGVDLVAEEVRNLLPDSVDVAGPTPTGKDEVGLLRSAEKLHTVTGVRAAGDAAADLVGEANTGAGPDRRRTPAERLAPNDELARLMLLEVSGERSPAMLRVSRLLDERTEDQTLQLADAETPAGQKAR
jgi:hypothetical protein